MAILIVLVGVVTITRMSTDIFPNINIPVVSVIWSYLGVAPEEMEKRFVTVSERAMTTTVNDIEHIESQSYNGVSVIKVFFHEGAKVEAGVAQITSVMQTLLHHHGVAGRTFWDYLDVVRDRDDAQRSLVDGSYHGDWRRYSEQHFGCHVCQR
jgi:hypothetical protein